MKIRQINRVAARRQKREKALNKKTGILDHIENIIEIVKKEGFENNKKLDIHSDYVAKRLDITPFQAVLFSLFMEKNSETTITIEDIAKTINCNNIKILKYANEFDILEDKKLIRCSRSRNSVSYRVPFEVCASLRKNNTYKYKRKENICIEELFVTFADIFEERQNNELTFDSLYIELMNLIDQNKHLEFCKKVKNLKLSMEDFTLFLLFCHLFGNNDDDNIRKHDYEFIYDNRFDAHMIENDLAKGEHELFKLELIEHNLENGLKDPESLKLSNKAKKGLFSDLGIKKKNLNKKLTQYENIKPKTMFYNDKEKESVLSFSSLLQEENYQKILERLDKKGMRKGFACLLSGPPGTGKTETAYQIARETKRNIMVIDISETKSCWYGESEKIIKKIFNDYREAVEESEIAPILLLNEADGIIGKRGAYSSDNKVIDETENRIQNIILQEMENLSGILIATTNLTQNMDSAFERRFLYKITLEKPSIESRIGLWKSMLPSLPEEITKELAEKFELSGGQIENISRKLEVDSVLNDTEINMDLLTKFCKQELDNGFNAGSKRIGFVG